MPRSNRPAPIGERRAPPGPSRSGPGRSAFLVAGALLAAACGHPLKNGTYTITNDGAPVRDDCKLADGGVSWSGALSTSGQEVVLHVTIPIPGGATELDEMAGFFKTAEYGEDDGFLVDGSEMQIATPVHEVAGGCLADTLTSHLDADITDDTHFSGLLTLDYELTPPPDGSNPCSTFTRCQLQMHVNAARNP